MRVVRSRLASWITKGTPSADELHVELDVARCRAARPTRAPAGCFQESVPRRPGVRRSGWQHAAQSYPLRSREYRCRSPRCGSSCRRCEPPGSPAWDGGRGARRHRRRLRGLPPPLSRRRPLGGGAHARSRDCAKPRTGRGPSASRMPEAWQRYLAEWPDGAHAAEARQRTRSTSSRRARRPRPAVTSSSSAHIRAKPRPGRTRAALLDGARAAAWRASGFASSRRGALADRSGDSGSVR